MRRWRNFILFVLLVAAIAGYLYAHRQYALRDVVPPGATPAHAPLTRSMRHQASSADSVALFTLLRDDGQSEALAGYQTVMDDPRASPEVRKAAGMEFLALTRAIEWEREAEDLLHAKGFPEVAVLIADGRAVVVLGVRSRLTAPTVAEVAYTVSEVSGIPLYRISVLPEGTVASSH